MTLIQKQKNMIWSFPYLNENLINIKINVNLKMNYMFKKGFESFYCNLCLYKQILIYVCNIKGRLIHQCKK
jgi:hypothetical protein